MGGVTRALLPKFVAHVVSTTVPRLRFNRRQLHYTPKEARSGPEQGVFWGVYSCSIGGAMPPLHANHVRPSLFAGLARRMLCEFDGVVCAQLTRAAT